MHNTPLNIYDAQDAKDENIKSNGDAIDRPTNQQTKQQFQCKQRKIP